MRFAKLDFFFAAGRFKRVVRFSKLKLLSILIKMAAFYEILEMRHYGKHSILQRLMQVARWDLNGLLGK